MDRTWKDELFEEMYTPYPTMEKVYQDVYSTKEEDIGMVHPTRGTGILLRKNGTIEGFADYNLGFRIDPDSSVFSIYAPTIRIHADSIEKIKYEDVSYFTGEIAEIKEYMNK